MPQTMVMDDPAIVAAFRNLQQREAAFTHLVTKYRERLYWHIRRMVVVHHDADDILQNVFIKTWRGLEDFREEANLYTWLYRIATNETLTWIEREKKHSARSLDGNEDIFTPRLQAEENYNPNKIEWKLQQAILSLPDKQRLVFNLRYYDEMPYEQMSTLLDTSVGALKASYHHAVKKVEAKLLDV